MPPVLPPDLAKKFGLAPLPESVKRLAQLIAKREASTEDIAKIISPDKELTARLLRAANPRASNPDEYVATTVEEALQRTGMSFALLLAMSDPLVRAVLNSFHTMMSIELKAMGPTELVPFREEHVLGEVSFTGKAAGLVHLRLPTTAVALVGGRMLGLSAADLADPAVANDVVGELCNMIVGNFKSNLCDAGLNCKLSTPKITRTEIFKLHVVDGGTAERLGFRAREVDLFVDLSVNPWND